jgi:hypothetical protein
MNTTTHEESNALAVSEPAQIGSTALVLNVESMGKMMRLAEMMASGNSTVPKHLQENPADCMAVVMQSMQWGLNPFAVAQKTHIVNGTLGYEAQLVNAVVQSSGSITGRFHYEFKGAKGSMECRVGAVIRGEEGITWGEWVNEAHVTTKNSPLWKVNPKQQLGYLQVKNWARLYCPGAILGVYSPDEFDAAPPRNMGRAEVVAPPEADAALIEEAHAAASMGMGEYQAFWQGTGATHRKSLAGHHEDLKVKAVAADKERTVSPPPAAPAARPEITYASVLEKMLKAANMDALGVAADWIGEVNDPGQRAELSAKYEELATKLSE